MSRSTVRSPLYYDEDDHRLLDIVNKILTRGKTPSMLRKLFDPALHPRGIKELAAPRSLRLASAMIDLLGTLEEGTPEERIAALRAVHAESLHESGQTARRNAARVLLQIMKEIVRAGGDVRRQLALAHDFREASSGKLRLVRKQLRKYHLLEMPEAWNQLAFDHHVHDANTKGRKSPTHLILDAWIKGIRFLGVIYYNLVRPEVAAELLEAADIMGIEVRIGIEVSACLRHKTVPLIWAPRGFLDRQDFLRFLQEPAVKEFLAKGQAVVDYERRGVLESLRRFNQVQLPRLCEQLGISVPALDEEAFLDSVGSGQASRVHIAEFAHKIILPHLQRRAEALSAGYPEASQAERAEMREQLAALNALDPETLVEEYLRPDGDEEAPWAAASQGGDDVPELLCMSPSALLDVLEGLPCRSRITLNPSHLTPADVLTVLYQGKGRITHLEIYNEKDWALGRTEHRQLINDIRLVINSGNVVLAKRMVREILAPLESGGAEEDLEAAETLRGILRDLRTLLAFYSTRRLQSRLGSDSIGLSRYARGMGLAVVATLPLRARREVRADPERLIPVATVALRHAVDVPRRGRVPMPALSPWQEDPVGAPNHDKRRRRVSWSVGHNATTLAQVGNIASLGGMAEKADNGLRLQGLGEGEREARPPRPHLNSGALNVGKVLLGFLPAFLTFYLSKDWWLLAYFGAVIWFGITGFRNILQSVVGGGGIRRSSLLNWKDLVSWGRVADSLLFTGFSVPLLDYLVKTLLLSRGFGVTLATAPITLYTVMALANGIYISSHNTYRGLPLAAIVGNFFRTVLSIPVALGLNYVILRIVLSFDVSEAAALAGMQLWAAIISKTASDFVAALIEGTADRQQNLAQRRADLGEKLVQVYAMYGRLEAAYPEQDVLALLERPEPLSETLGEEHQDLLRLMVVNSLDLLYFWMYQPRARIAFAQQMLRMSPDEHRFLLQSQQVLREKRVISEMLLGGLVGKRFERPLAFYLSQSDRYLRACARLAQRA